jgi:hypothetical protein
MASPAATYRASGMAAASVLGVPIPGELTNGEILHKMTCR